MGVQVTPSSYQRQMSKTVRGRMLEPSMYILGGGVGEVLRTETLLHKRQWEWRGGTGEKGGAETVD